jgi:leucyl aminopeptidase
MPTLEYAKQSPAAVKVGTLAVFAGSRDGAVAVLTDAGALGAALDVDLEAELAAVRFEGDLGAVARIPARGKVGAGLVLVVGVGDVAVATLETLRRAAGCAARSAIRDSTLAVVVPADLVEHATDLERARAVTEGAGLGAYTFTAYRSKRDDLPALASISVLPGQGIDARAARSGVTEGSVLVEATCMVRDLVNEPPQAKRPPVLAERIAELAKDAGIKARIFDEKALAKEGFGGIIGVGQGSSAPPRLVELTYDPTRAKGHVVLAGKGITFDSGGLSIKPATAMMTMKSDMSGAAAVLGAMVAIARLGVRTKVTGLVALAENMPSGTAIRPSDVLTHRGGRTVEVLNTDAEGRLVLADALAYGAERQPDALIDVATLTGAVTVALGDRVAGVMGTDRAVVYGLLAAAEAAGEPLWELPLYSDYADLLKSEVADMKNIGKPGKAGTIVAGLFLKEFTAGVPWAHLDIAGPAFTEEGDAFYTSRGGTGVPVRTLVQFLRARAG